MKRNLINFLLGVLIFALTIFASYGSVMSHDFTMTTDSHVSYNEEVITLKTPEVVEVAAEDIPIKSDIQIIAEAVMGEAGAEPLVGKVAVAATIFNRMEYYNQTALEALEAYSGYPYHGVVINDCYIAVEIAMENRDLFPSNMMYFRAGTYHDFGIPYTQIGNHYFSLKE